MAFDEESGLVYSETTVPVQQELFPMYRPGFLRPKPTPNRGASGSRTLFDTSMLALLRNLNALGTNSLNNVPRHIIERIWKPINHSLGVDSVRLWMLFAPTGVLQKTTFGMVQEVQLRSPDSNRIFPIVSDPTCAWLVDLRLEGVSLTTELLLSIPQLPNLSYVSIFRQARNSEETGFSDRIMRSWGQDAAANGAFSRLSAIFVEYQQGVTEASLRHLNAFPALREFSVHMCGLVLPRRSMAESLGWVEYRSERKRWSFGEFCERKHHNGPCSPFAIYDRGIFQHVVEQYLHDEIRDGTKVEPLPSIHLTLKDDRSQGTGAFWKTYDHLFCFRRIRHVRQQSEVTAVLTAGSAEITKSKKRKFKDYKSLSLSEVLEGL